LLTRQVAGGPQEPVALGQDVQDAGLRGSGLQLLLLDLDLADTPLLALAPPLLAGGPAPPAIAVALTALAALRASVGLPAAIATTMLWPAVTHPLAAARAVAGDRALPRRVPHLAVARGTLVPWLTLVLGALRRFRRGCGRGAVRLIG
jgi:hypothetical protein